MRLVLTVISEEQFDLGHRMRCAFDQSGGTIGRNANCHWVLPDPTNTMSARHATITHNGRGFLITDTSTNGVYLNTVEAPVGRGNQAILSDGDTLYLGHYVICVELSADKTEDRTIQRPAAAALSGLDSPPLIGQAEAATLDADLSAFAPGVPDPLPAMAAMTIARAAPRPAASMDDLLRLGPTRDAAATQTLPSRAVSTPLPPLGPPSIFAPPVGAAAVGAAVPRGARTIIPDDFLADILGPQVGRPAGALGPAPLPIGFGLAGSAPALDAGAAVPRGIPQDFDFGPILPHPRLDAVAPQAAPEPQAFPQPKPSATPEPPDLGAPPALRAPPPQRPLGRKPLAEDMVTLRRPGLDEAAAGPAALDPVAVLRQRASAAFGASNPAPGLDAAPVPAPTRRAPMPGLTPAVAPRSRAREDGAMPMPMPGAAAPAPAPDKAAAQRPASGAIPAAFWEGLGIDPAAIPEARQSEIARELGMALRQALNGMVPVLAARRSLKDAMRMDQTQLQGQDNNPLKFLPSGDAVLQALAAGSLSGFMPLSQAVREGFGDIKAHEVAAVVALQAVAGSLIARFDPTGLQAQGSPGKLFGRGADKAKNWDAFVALHASLANRSDETTRKIVNEEFSRAYDEQVRIATTKDR